MSETNIINNGIFLCSKDVQYFLNISPRHGIELFEDITILMSISCLENKIDQKIFYLNENLKNERVKLCQFLFVLLNNEVTNPLAVEWVDSKKKDF